MMHLELKKRVDQILFTSTTLRAAFSKGAAQKICALADSMARRQLQLGADFSSRLETPLKAAIR
jgi:hypothetical protein